ncbi:MAG TPA: carbohydrate-binding domain-containing protein, partial [Methanocorpusculum sp.]|nr:carbohydrate-binding domain-containing protein [Methanocorpusculum sp.]
MKPSEKRILIIMLVLLALGIVFVSLILFAPGIPGSTETDNVSDYGLSIDVAYSARDLDPSYDENSATLIYLADGASYVEGSGASVYGDVITITNEGTYIARGSLSDGQIVISAGESDKVQLVLDGVVISCSD